MQPSEHGHNTNEIGNENGGARASRARRLSQATSLGDEGVLMGTKASMSDLSSFGDEDEARRGLIPGKSKGGHARHGEKRERLSTAQFMLEMLIETLPTLLLSTIGLTITGEMVEVVADWKAISRIDELFILVPVLTNMKGNLEMNLSSRLGTSAYLGHLDTRSSRQSIIGGSILLLQVQALLISAAAGVFSFVLSAVMRKIEGVVEVGGFVRRLGRGGMVSLRDVSPLGAGHGTSRGRKKPVSGGSGFKEFVFVVCTSMTSASVSALTLGCFMCTLVLLCRRYKIDPDIVGPPIAAALGDLVTLFLLAVFSVVFLPLLPTVLPLFFTLLLLGFTGFLTYLTYCNVHVRPLLKQGWTPLIGAMLITSFSGLVLDQFVNRYEGYGLLAIVITGLPGGVGSIYISRISTLLHAASPGGLKGKGVISASNSSENLGERAPLRSVDDEERGGFEDPVLNSHPRPRRHTSTDTLPPSPSDSLTQVAPSHYTPSIHHHHEEGEEEEEEEGVESDPTKEGRLPLFCATLFVITFPVQILFFFFLHFSGWVEFSWTFVWVFMVTFSLTTITTLALAQWMTYWLWSKGLDPDMYAMPILSSVVDVFAQFALVICYEIAIALGSDMITKHPQ